MKALAFLGSPRKGGNSEVLLEAFVKGMEQEGGEVEIIRLPKLDISPCISCGGCDKAGECVVKDDMTELYDKILAAKRIVLASPIFFYGVTAQAKAFLDRCQALWNRKRLLKEAGKWQQDENQKGYFLCVAATMGKKVFDGAVLSVQYGYDAMGFLHDGEYLVNGIDGRGEMAAAKDIIAEAERLGRQFMK